MTALGSRPLPPSRAPALQSSIHDSVSVSPTSHVDPANFNDRSPADPTAVRSRTVGPQAPHAPIQVSCAHWRRSSEWAPDPLRPLESHLHGTKHLRATITISSQSDVLCSTVRIAPLRQGHRARSARSARGVRDARSVGLSRDAYRHRQPAARHNTSITPISRKVRLRTRPTELIPSRPAPAAGQPVGERR